MSNEKAEGNPEQDQPKGDGDAEYTERQLQSSFEHSLKISSSGQETTSSSDQAAQQPSETTSTTERKSSTSQSDVANSTLRSDAPEFKPAPKSNEKPVVDQTTTASSGAKFDMLSSSAYDLKKFRHEFFVSQLKCSFDPENGKFSSPSGLTALPDDRLLVADFNRDSIFLINLNGVVEKIYPLLKSPKDVLYHSSRPNQATVATQKELIAIDLEKNKRILTSKVRGFYPWNVQYLANNDVYAACDPSGERILYLDKNFEQVGEFSVSEMIPKQGNQKIYPYAVSFGTQQNAFILNHYGNSCQLHEIALQDTSIRRTIELPHNLKSFSIYADAAGKCLIADELNQRLVSYDQASNMEEYRLKSGQNPYSMTFLSDGSLCVTCRNASQPSNSGVCVLSEENRRPQS